MEKVSLLRWNGVVSRMMTPRLSSLIENPDASSPRPLVHGIVAGLAAAHQGGVGEGGLITLLELQRRIERDFPRCMR
jgi:hypothetical protein